MVAQMFPKRFCMKEFIIFISFVWAAAAMEPGLQEALAGPDAWQIVPWTYVHVDRVPDWSNFEYLLLEEQSILAGGIQPKMVDTYVMPCVKAIDPLLPYIRIPGAAVAALGAAGLTVGALPPHVRYRFIEPRRGIETALAAKLLLAGVAGFGLIAYKTNGWIKDFKYWLLDRKHKQVLDSLTKINVRIDGFNSELEALSRQVHELQKQETDQQVQVQDLLNLIKDLRKDHDLFAKVYKDSFAELSGNPGSGWPGSRKNSTA